MLHTRFNDVRSSTGAGRMIAQSKPVLPAALVQEGARIMAFSNVPLHHSLAIRTASPITNNRYSAEGPYWFDDLKQAYDYPDFTVGHTVDGTGVSVAVLMSDLLFPGDVGRGFNHEKFTTHHRPAAPRVTTVTVDGGGVRTAPARSRPASTCSRCWAARPAHEVTLVSIPDLSDQSIIDGYSTIVDSNQFDIVNSSFGGCELEYTAAYNGGTDFTSILQTYHEIFAAGQCAGDHLRGHLGRSGRPALPDRRTTACPAPRRRSCPA